MRAFFLLNNIHSIVMLRLVYVREWKKIWGVCLRACVRASERTCMYVCECARIYLLFTAICKRADRTIKIELNLYFISRTFSRLKNDLQFSFKRIWIVLKFNLSPICSLFWNSFHFNIHNEHIPIKWTLE